MRIPVALKLPPELVAHVDQTRGDVTRTRWIQRAIEAALSPVAGRGGDPVMPAGSPRREAGDSPRLHVPYACPIALAGDDEDNCFFGTTDPLAVCERHNRRVVGVR